MTTVDGYVGELDGLLRVGRRQRAVLLDEVRDHLSESTAAGLARGVAPAEAEADAVAAFGPPDGVARPFNAAAGARAMRRSPVVAAATGVGVVAAFLGTASLLPRNTQSASVAMQVSFFAAVLAFQVAVVAGLRGASRAAAVWSLSATSGEDRGLVRRCTLASTSALSVGAVAMAAALGLDASHLPHANAAALTAGAVAMVLVAVVGLVASLRLGVNPADTDPLAVGRPRRVLTAGETVLARVRRRPVVSCTAATLVATAWAMNLSETTFPASLWWGAAEALTVVAAFVALGPALGLRPGRTATR